MGDADRNNMAGDDRNDRDIPDGFRADDADIYPVIGGAEHIPAYSKRIVGERNDELPRDQQIG